MSYYPSSRYVARNLAPEQKLTTEDIQALAKAAKTAVKNGVLTEEQAQYMLPMAMVEGRSGNYGIRQDGGFPATAANVERFKKMGLSITDWTDPKTQEQDRWDSAETVPDAANPGQTKLQYFRHTRGPDGTIVKIPTERVTPGAMSIFRKDGGKLIGPSGEAEGDPINYAAMMAAILSEKASQIPNGSVDDHIKRYNGVGKAMEFSDGKYTPADTSVYLNKVKDAKAMLEHPKNAPLVDLYRRAAAAE